MSISELIRGFRGTEDVVITLSTKYAASFSSRVSVAQFLSFNGNVLCN